MARHILSSETMPTSNSIHPSIKCMEKPQTKSDIEHEGFSLWGYVMCKDFVELANYTP